MTIDETAQSPYRRAAAWNLLYLPGTRVVVQAPAGNWCPTTTRSPATVHAGRPVVCVHDYPGEWPLDLVRPVRQLDGAA